MDYVVRQDSSTEVQVKLVFHSIKSVLSSYRTEKGGYIFNNLPVGEKVTIVAIKYENERTYLAMKESTISELGESPLAFEPASAETLKSALGQLNSIN